MLQRDIKSFKAQLALLHEAIDEYSKLQNHVNHDMSIQLADMRQRVYETQEKTRIEVAWVNEKTDEHLKKAE